MNTTQWVSCSSKYSYVRYVPVLRRQCAHWGYGKYWYVNVTSTGTCASATAFYVFWRDWFDVRNYVIKYCSPCVQRASVPKAEGPVVPLHVGPARSKAKVHKKQRAVKWSRTTCAQSPFIEDCTHIVLDHFIALVVNLTWPSVWIFLTGLYTYSSWPLHCSVSCELNLTRCTEIFKGIANI